MELKFTLTNTGTNTYQVNPVGDETMDWMADNLVSTYLPLLNLLANKKLVLSINGYWGDVYLDKSRLDKHYPNGEYMGDGTKLVWIPREESILAIKLHKNYLDAKRFFDKEYPFKSLLTEASWNKVFEEGIALHSIANIIKPKAVLTFTLI